MVRRRLDKLSLGDAEIMSSVISTTPSEVGRTAGEELCYV